jgi:hypothetical protein
MSVLVAAVAVTGCGSFRDVFTSHAETAARVGSKELKSARVAEIIGRLGGPNANPQAADLITGIWVDMSLFGDQVASGQLKTDSATIERLMWPQLSEQKISSWHDTVVARRPVATRELADTLYQKGEQRLFQHILFMPAGPTPADTAKAKALADRTRPQINAANFGKLALQFSSDGSKNDGGYLYIAPRGGFVKEFDDAAWALAPGEITGVVKSPFGFHVIRRPTLEESRDRFFAKVSEMHKAHQDSLYMAELSSRVSMQVKPGAAAAIKDALKDIDDSRSSKKALVTSTAGDFTVGDLIRWLNALPPTAVASIKQADDSLLNVFVETLAKNAILLQQADSAKITINPTMYEALALQFKTQVNQLKAAVGLDGPEFSDTSKVAVAERRKLAAEKADQYFEKLITGQAQFVPVPPTLSAELRTTGDFKIYPAGVNRAVELIIAKKSADSAAGGNLPPGAPRPGGLQPAPGGPPAGGQRDTTKSP